VTVERSTSRVRGLVRGLWMGALAGVAWGAGEWALATVAGSVAPRAFWGTVAGADVTLGAIAGAGAGLLAPERGTGAATGLAVVLAFGLAQVVSPPGLGGEALYLAIAAGVWLLGMRVLAGETRSALAAVHVTLVGLAAIVGGALVLEGVHVQVPHGARLVAAVVAAPLGLLALDGGIGFLVPSRARRLAGGIVLVVVAGALWGRVIDVAPLVDDVVTGVPPPAGTPDVLVVTLDTTRADHLSTYGYARETSPNLTRLAHDGVLYRDARSPAGWTLPGHASLMTGLYPSSHGAELTGGWVGGESIDGRRNVARPLAASHETLAEVLRDRGYRTAGIVSNFSYLYRDYGLAQGFGFYDDAPGTLLRVELPIVHLIRLVQPAFGVKPFRTAREINAAALAWLDAAGRDRPTFMFLNYMEPHQPWVAEAPYDGWARGVPGAWALERTNLYTHAVRPVPAATARFVVASYDGQLAAMDAALGELIDALVARRRYENTLIVVAGDHGELLGEHSELGHMGRTLYEPLLRVPLVVKYPGGARAGSVVEYPVQLVDVMPTVVAVAGAHLPAEVEGAGLDVEHRVVYAEEGINPFLVADYGAFYDRAMRVVYDGDYKLLSTSRGKRMLFDLKHDPGEEHDLAAERPERLARLEALLAERPGGVLALASDGNGDAAEGESTWRGR
jgi:arylsulfatase A-like enzyme